MRCPYCQQNIRVQGRFCPKCGEQIFGLPVRPPSGTGGQPAPSSSPPPPPPPLARPPQRTVPRIEDNIEIETEPVSPPPTVGPARTTPGAHPASGDEIGKTCPYCRFPIKPGEQVFVCPACKVVHHNDCWTENQGCTTYGCRGVAATTPAPAPVYHIPSRPSAWTPSPRGGAFTPPSLENLQETELAARARNAFIFGLIGLLPCCIPLSLVAVFMGYSILGELKRHAMNVPQARSKAIWAIALGAVELLFALIYVLSALAHR